MNLNWPASIGFIALFGVAILNGVVLVSSMNQLVRSGPLVRDAVITAQVRLRSAPMTACAATSHQRC